MKNIYFLLIYIAFSSCSSEVDCNEIKYIDGVSYYNGEKFTGNCSSYFLNGNLSSQQSYLNGLDNDNWTFFYSNKNLKTEAYFNNGKRIGQWKYYAKNGNIWKVNTYNEAGKPSGEWKTFDTINGNLSEVKNAKEIFN